MIHIWDGCYGQASTASKERKRIMSTPFRLIREVNTTGFGDTGMRALYAIADTRGNGRQDILAYNRTRLWHWAQE